MKFKTHNDTEINTNGTFHVGEICASFEQLLKVFGTPLGESPDNKVDVEWHVEAKSHDGPITIYNYKDGVAYLGESGKNPADIEVWNIGSNRAGKFLASEVIETILNEK